MMKFELEESNRGITDEELLDDMRRCAQAIGRDTVTIAEYERVGKASPSTVKKRFGSWPKALEQAGLQPSRSKIGITNEELFENIKSLWISLGRQPRYAEVRTPASRFSASTYDYRFGSWSRALREFVAWVNSDSPEEPQQEATETNQGPAGSTVQTGSAKRHTRREVSDRQRFRILVRDGFRCRACGASPLTQVGVELHVDHVLPWSKGGETTDGNLLTKCKQCNLGKGNAFNA
jgi:5-methylcytosine-specific restriction endonuclease McrA